MRRVLLTLMLAGLLAPPAHALEFADLTTTGEDAIGGTLLGSSVSVTGPAINAQVVDGTATWFSGPYFTPPLATSDGFQIHGHTSWAYTIVFGAPVKEPTLQINSLASRLVFPTGTRLEIVSGHAAMRVDGNVLVGATFLNSNNTYEDPSGTVRVLGTVASLRFDTEYPGDDGILMTVGGSAPDPPDAGGGGGGGGAAISDRDGDHVTDDADCRPDDPAIYPGAPDTPGDGIDQDCFDGDAQMPEVKRDIVFSYRAAGASAIKARRLTVRKPRAGDTFRVSCLHCAGEDGSVTVPGNRRKLSLLRFVRGVRLHEGAVLRVRVDHPERISRIYSFRVRRPPKDPVPGERCQAPGALRPTACRR